MAAGTHLLLIRGGKRSPREFYYAVDPAQRFKCDIRRVFLSSCLGGGVAGVRDVVVVVFLVL